MHNLRKRIFYPVIKHILLELPQILRAPCTENIVVPAEFHQPFKSLRKTDSAIQLFFRKRHDFFYRGMKLLIYDRAHNAVKHIRRFSVFIQFYSTNLNNLKGQVFLFILLALRRLVPLQI